MLVLFTDKHLDHFFLELKSPSIVIRRIQDFARTVADYKENRGMEFWTDVRDWLGGWPMDFLKESEVIEFAESRLGLELLDMFTGEGNTEFVFQPLGAKNYWDKLLEQYVIESLNPSFSHNEGYCWAASLPHLSNLGDTEEKPTFSNLRLYDEGKQLLFAHAPCITIQKAGAGRYSHWQDNLYFSTSDNSDPNTNGRRYTIRYLPSVACGFNPEIDRRLVEVSG